MLLELVLPYIKTSTQIKKINKNWRKVLKRINIKIAGNIHVLAETWTLEV